RRAPTSRCRPSPSTGWSSSRPRRPGARAAPPDPPPRSKNPPPAPPPARRASLLAPPPEREPGMGAGMAAAIYLGLALLYFLPAFLPGKQIYGTDFSNAGFFFQEFLSRSFAAGHLPRWVPYLMGGV